MAGDDTVGAVREYYIRVQRRFRYLVVDSHTADDLSQEVFGRLIDELSVRRSTGQLWMLIVGTMKNVFCEHLRRKAFARSKTSEEDFAVATVGIPDPRPSLPQVAIEHNETLTSLRKLLDTLDAEDQALITARFFLGMTGEQMGELFRVERRTVVYRLHRALERLREAAINDGLML